MYASSGKTRKAGTIASVSILQSSDQYNRNNENSEMSDVLCSMCTLQWASEQTQVA